MKKYASYGDAELIRYLREKEDQAAYEELYHRYWKKLLVQALIKLKSEVEAEEVVQDVFLSLWERRTTIEITKTVHTYMASCVKYQILTRLARQRKHAAFEQESRLTVSDGANQTENWLDYETTRRQIEDTVQGLPEKCQLVFRLSREEGRSQKEIAEALGVSTKTVETHLGKALKVIRSSLQQFLFSLF
ncbi:MAG: RNA polymerase sigma-70 factor [Mangrovibacterium sp.]|nr:RNA polymerase sigma-70 factor [Mangrovibacterium sp.]